jgi:2-methylisocitrate lyase-like PEP mutase family enzyme
MLGVHVRKPRASTNATAYTAGMTPFESFRSLHFQSSPLVLANAWDPVTARLVEAVGATAVATSSAAVSWAHGVADGEQLPRQAALSVAREIVLAVHVPVTVDLEAGYSSDPGEVAALVQALADVGVAGINLEDGRGPPQLLAAKIERVKQVARAGGVDVFVNARTDVYLKSLVAPEQAVDETLRRAALYHGAGCDGLFVPGVVREDAIRAIAEGTKLPLNVLVVPGLAPVAELVKWGVKRVSAGTAVACAALGVFRHAARELVESGTYARLFGECVMTKEMNALFST